MLARNRSCEPVGFSKPGTSALTGEQMSTQAQPIVLPQLVPLKKDAGNPIWAMDFKTKIRNRHKE